MSTAGQFHFVNGVIRGVDDDYNTRMLKAVRNVTVDEIKKVMKDVLRERVATTQREGAPA